MCIARWYNTTALCTCPVLVHYGIVVSHCRTNQSSVAESPTERRLSIASLAVRQNGQMSRLCDLTDPNVEVIYVSPFPLSEDVEGYYEKLLNVGGVEQPRARYRIVYPENHG